MWHLCPTLTVQFVSLVHLLENVEKALLGVMLSKERCLPFHCAYAQCVHGQSSVWWHHVRTS